MFGEINERSEVLDDITGLIPNRVYEKGGPELAAILATVVNFRTTLRSALKLGFNFR